MFMPKGAAFCYICREKCGLNQPTLDKLATLRLHGMAEAFRSQSDPAQRDSLAGLSFEERFGLLVDQEWTWRQNRALARRLSQAKFR